MEGVGVKCEEKAYDQPLSVEKKRLCWTGILKNFLNADTVYNIGQHQHNSIWKVTRTLAA